MNNRKSQHKHLYNFVSAVLILVLPFTAFLKHHGYPIFSWEILIIFVTFLFLGAVSAFLMSIQRGLFLATITSLLLLVLIDIQFEWASNSYLIIAISLLALWTICSLLKTHLSQGLSYIFGAMFLATCVIPGEGPVSISGPTEDTDNTNNNPIILHIVLDEHIGLGEIPPEFDDDGKTSKAMLDFYLENSFLVFDKAYSRYYNTEESISNLLNFSASTNSNEFFEGEYNEGDTIQKNAWFQYLFNSGYSIHVVQSDYLLFSPFPYGENQNIIESTYSYKAEAIYPASQSELPINKKIPLIIGTYIKLSKILPAALNRYSRISSSLNARKIPLPQLNQFENVRVSPLSSMQAFDDLATILQSAQRGNAYFAHIMLPHYPYAYDPNCQLKQDGPKWLQANDPSLHPRRNNPASRALRYPDYLDQVLCTRQKLDEIFSILKERGLWNESIVIIHGDHGSRLDMGPPLPGTLEKMKPRDFFDAYSTLFAVKHPKYNPGANHAQLPIDQLFYGIVRDSTALDDRELEENPFVLIKQEDNSLSKYSMPVK